MKRIMIGMAVLLAIGIAGYQSRIEAQAGREVVLFDGKSIDGWRKVGDANWRITNGYVEATMGSGHLVSANPYTNFQITAEFWTDADANSGLFIRCANPADIGADKCYEVNIFDKRPDPKYRTGAIVNVAEPKARIDAAGKWNTYDITAQGSHLVIKLNGTTTVDVMDSKFASGHFTLQYGAGIVRFRNVKIRPL